MCIILKIFNLEVWNDDDPFMEKVLEGIIYAT